MGNRNSGILCIRTNEIGRMDDAQFEFLTSLIESPGPSGYETQAQQVWIDYVTPFADEITTDDYGNAMAILHGGDPTIVLTGHGDEIGMITRRIDDDGFIHPSAIGGLDKSVTRGQRVRIHTDDGPILGVIGQDAIHLRDSDDEDDVELNEYRIDIGADSGEHARELLEIGDPITYANTVERLSGTRIAGRGLDNRAGTLVAAEGLRLAANHAKSCTVIAVSTVQEEIGLQGARMLGFDPQPDAVLGVDVSHAFDYPNAPTNKGSDIALGDGPVVARGSSNHPRLVELARDTAADTNIPVQLRAAGSGTGTDIDAFYTRYGGVPSITIGIPTRYMHTPVEVVDTTDISTLATLLAEITRAAREIDSFAIEYE